MYRQGDVLLVPSEIPEGADYFLRVPPSMRTAKEAVEWTFEQDELNLVSQT